MPDLPISSLPAATTGYSNSLLVIVNYNPISSGRTEAVPFSAITASIAGTSGTNGTNGSSGTNGTSGSSGTNGTSGTSASLNSTSGNTDTLGGVAMRTLYSRTNVINYTVGSDSDFFSGSTNFGSRNFPTQFFTDSVNYNSKIIHFRVTGKWGGLDNSPQVDIVTKFGSDTAFSFSVSGSDTSQANNHPSEIFGEIVFSGGTAIGCYSIGWCSNNGDFKRYALSDASSPIVVSGFTGGDFQLIMSGGTTNSFTTYLGYIQVWD